MTTMGRMHLGTFAIVALLIGAAAVAPALTPGPSGGGPPAHAAAKGQPDCGPNVVAENDDVRLWFHGTKAFVKVFVKDDEGSGLDGMYQVKSDALVERDGDETVAEMNLQRAFPQSSTCEVEEDDTFVNITYHVDDAAVRDTDGGLVGHADATFAYHFNRSSDGAKFDLIVEDWPWTSEGELAFDFGVDAGGLTIETAENGLGFRDSDGEAEGFITWAPNATAHYEDGHQEEAIVDSSVTGSDHHADVRLRFTNATAGYETLVYDPWYGSGLYVIVGPLLVPVGEIPDVLPAPVDDVLAG